MNHDISLSENLRFAQSQSQSQGLTSMYFCMQASGPVNHSDAQGLCAVRRGRRKL
jgi:hypothetical protein